MLLNGVEWKHEMLCFRLVVNISLSTSYYGIDPNSCSRIWCCLQMIAAPFCFHNECAMWSTTLRCIQMVQVYLIDGLCWKRNNNSDAMRSQIFETNKTSAMRQMNIPWSRHHPWVFARIYPNSRWALPFVDPIQTSALTTCGMWHPIYEDICRRHMCDQNWKFH